jgi:hypothetical protein
MAKEVKILGKPRFDSKGGIAVTVHAVNRFRTRCSLHPLAKKGSANQIQRCIRYLIRRGEDVAHASLKEEERLVRLRYETPRNGEQSALALLAPEKRKPEDYAVLTILTSDMTVGGILPRD